MRALCSPAAGRKRLRTPGPPHPAHLAGWLLVICLPVVTTDVSAVVVWRWIDAVVLEAVDGVIRLWEPAHGIVLAQPRDPKHIYRPGSRAYLSAGLPCAEWWVAGPAVGSADDADVKLDEVQRFFTSAGLWERLT